MLDLTLWDAVTALVVGGFVGSAAGGIVVIYMYLTSPEDLEPEPAPAGPVPERELLTAPPEKPFQETIEKPPLESDKDRIKRLEKEIRKLKKMRSNKSQ
ncbi:MAG: hypothetical protein V1793_22190 [Pseudomonadota bacterium]